MDEQLRLVKNLAEKVRADLLGMYPASRSMNNPDLMTLNNGRFRFFDESYCGACAVASYMLFEASQKKGIPLEYVGVMDHFWCELDGTVIDPTYSQFDWQNPIWVGKPTRFHEPMQMDFPRSIIRRRPLGRLEVVGMVTHKGLYKGDLALWSARLFPAVQSPFSKINRPKIKKWLGGLTANI